VRTKMAKKKAAKAKKAATVSGGIKVYCAYKEMVDTKKVKPNPLNPYKHNEKQIVKLAEAIKEDGWRHCITVSNRSGLIVSGHCRLLAAQALKLKEVPVDYQDFDSEGHEYSVLVSDNIIAEFNVIDGAMMADMINFVDESEIPVARLGMDEDQMLDYIHGPTDDPTRPVFDNIIDQFAEENRGKSDKDEKWFYIEYYQDGERFEEITKLIGDGMKTAHEIDREVFYELIKKAFKS